MVSVNLDDKTAKELTALAAERGMTLEEYLRMLSQRVSLESTLEVTAEEFDAELNPLLFDGPPSPDDFSRADIYTDHD